MKQKEIAYNEKFILVVDLFDINYLDGEKSINLFEQLLIRANLLFGRSKINKTKGHRFKIEVSVTSAAKVERFLNQM